MFVLYAVTEPTADVMPMDQKWERSKEQAKMLILAPSNRDILWLDRSKTIMWSQAFTAAHTYSHWRMGITEVFILSSNLQSSKLHTFTIRTDEEKRSSHELHSTWTSYHAPTSSNNNERDQTTVKSHVHSRPLQQNILLWTFGAIHRRNKILMILNKLQYTDFGSRQDRL